MLVNQVVYNVSTEETRIEQIEISDTSQKIPITEEPTLEERIASIEEVILNLLQEEISMYNFLLNMWIMKKVDEVYLQKRVAKGQITQNEYEMIIATPQI